MLGDRLKKLRESRKMTQTELGRVFGKSQKTIDFYEKGERQPKIDDLIKICNYFGVTSDYLLGKEPIQSCVIYEGDRKVIEQLLDICDDNELRKIREYLRFLIWLKNDTEE